MKKKGHFVLLLSFAGTTFIYSCRRELSCEGCAVNNKPPLAVAGPDQRITLPKDSALLDGSASTDPDGTITSYKWTKISGPVSSNIIRPDSAKTLVKTLVVGLYDFELTVTDNGGLAAKDTVQIAVNNAGVNQPPVACAGADQTITLPTNSVTLDGSCSADPDNNITSYVWAKISGPSANITNANAVQTQVTGLLQGVYQFELKVIDAGGLFTKDTIQVTVLPQLATVICDPLNRSIIGIQLVPVASIPFPRAIMTAVTVGNKLLLAGGSPENSPVYPVTDVSIYDFSTQSWSSANLTVPRLNITAATVGNKVFFAGGREASFSGSRRVDIYDASTNTWSFSDLPGEADFVSIAALGNKVFFATSRYPGGKVDVYDISSSTWSELNLSEPRIRATATVAGNKVYFTGGFVGPQPSAVIDVYDNSTATWSTSSLSQPTSEVSGYYLDGKMYWAGGRIRDKEGDFTDYTCKVEIRDVNTQTSSFTNFSRVMGFSSDYTQPLLYNHKLIYSTPDKLEIYDPQSNTWSIGDVPSGNYVESMVSVNNALYAVGFVTTGPGKKIANQIWQLLY
jgi:N-acetylneuraminic acid mutarotase